MANKKNFKILFLLSIMFASIITDEPVFSQESTSFSGTLLKKPWSKTTQSYCAGGSDYFVLKVGEEEIVLQRGGSDKTREAFFGKWVGKKVKIQGKKKEKKITNTDPMEQKPITFSSDGKPITDAPFTCTVIEVIRIEANK